jgi:hypothetical protein
VIDAGPPPGVPEGAKYDPYVGWVYTDEKGVQHQYNDKGMLMSQVVPGGDGKGAAVISYGPGAVTISQTSNGQTVNTHYKVQDGQLIPQSSIVISNTGDGAVYEYDYENGQVSRTTRIVNGQWRGAWDGAGHPIVAYKADSHEPIFGDPNDYNQLPSGRGQPPDLLGGNPLIGGLINGQMEKARTDPGSTNLAPLTPPAQSPGGGGTFDSSFNVYTDLRLGGRGEPRDPGGFPPLPAPLSDSPPPAGGAGMDGGEGAEEPPPPVSPERAKEQVEHEEYLEQKAKELEDLRDKGSLKNKKILDQLQAGQTLPPFNRDVGADQFLGSGLQFSLPPTGGEFASAADGAGAGPTQLANLDPQLDTGSGLLDGASSAPVLSPAVPAVPAAPAGPDLTALHTNFHGQQAADLNTFEGNQAADLNTLQGGQQTDLNNFQTGQGGDLGNFQNQLTADHVDFHNLFGGVIAVDPNVDANFHNFQDGQLNIFQAGQATALGNFQAGQATALGNFQAGQTADLAAEQAQQGTDHTDFHTQNGI